MSGHRDTHRRHRGAWFGVRACLAALMVLASGGCGSLADTTSKPEASAGKAAAPAGMRGHIVVTERASQGGRLVTIGEDGDRLDVLTRIGPVRVRDNSPALSPDGRWVVFTSSRARDSIGETSLWIVAAAPDAQPRRLTVDKEAVDNFPRFSPDGGSVVFASSRDGSFDLFRVALTTGSRGVPMAASVPERITSGPEHDFHPAYSPDGSRLVFTRLDADGTRSRLFVVELAGGEARPLSEGPFDASPRFSPDGRRIAFAGLSVDDPGDAGAGAEDDGVGADGSGAGAEIAGDADLFVMDADGSGRRLVVRESRADQTGPAWSGDGRYLFCTSIYRLGGEPILSSITFVDLDEDRPVLRALHDRLAVVSRMEPSLDGAALDGAALARNPTYQEALDRALETELLRSEE